MNRVSRFLPPLMIVGFLICIFFGNRHRNLDNQILETNVNKIVIAKPMIEIEDITDYQFPEKQKQKDVNCIKTLNVFQNEDGTFNIPSDDILTQLPVYVLDCLYHRTAMTIQTFCSNMTRHGSLYNWFNLCNDACYAPTKDTAIYFISTRNNDININTHAFQYRSRVVRFNIRSETKTNTFSFSVDKTDKITPKKLKNYFLSEKDTIIVIDVDNLTPTLVDFLLHDNILKYAKQIIMRTHYRKDTTIDYVTALSHLRRLYQLGFRTYWHEQEINGIMKGNEFRTSSFNLHMNVATQEGKVDIWKFEASSHHVCPRALLKAIHDSVFQNQDLRYEADFLESVVFLLDDPLYGLRPKVRGSCRVPAIGNTIDTKEIKEMNAEGLLQVFLRHITTTTIKCTEVLRMGKIRDGGWNVCHDKEYRPSKQCLVYSFGIKWDFSFDDAVKETYDCEIHSFDPSMNTSSFRRGPHSYFHNIGISGGKSVTDQRKRKWDLATLSDLLKRFKHTNFRIDILKIDIEFMEWAVLPNMLKTGVLRNVRQFMLEFHLYSNTLTDIPTLIKMIEYCKALYDEGFRIFWHHMNPACALTLRNSYTQNTRCHEIYFVNINQKNMKV